MVTIAGKLVFVLLASAMDSLALLERIEAKIDAQAMGKLRGAFRSLQLAAEQRTGTQVAVQMALGSLTESTEYFRSLIAAFDKEMNFEGRGTGAGKVLHWGGFLAGSVRDLLGLGGGQLNKLLRLEVEKIHCVNLVMLSEVGRIACMDALDFDSRLVARDLATLRATDWAIDDSDLFLESAVRRGTFPAPISRMSRTEFERCFGSVLKYTDVHPPDERQAMKEFVIEHYGSTIEEIRKKNPGYRSICHEAGREPGDLDEYVDFVMAARSGDDLVDKLGDWAEKKVLYWAEKDMLRVWCEAFLRYAALRTLLASNHSPRKLLAAVGAARPTGTLTGQGVG